MPGAVRWRAFCFSGLSVLQDAVPAVFDAVLAPIGQVLLGYTGPGAAELILQTDDCVILYPCPAALLILLLRVGIETLPALLARTARKV